jgi:mono/diheme cytochrome c family protein
MMGGGMMGGGMPMMMGRARADTAAAPRPVAAAAESTGVCPAVTQPAVDRGREIFGTRGNCYACHGPDAGGTAAAPDLRDAQWLDADGSYRSIIALVRSGVPHPKQYPAAMPPEGGAALSDAELCAVAAYVRSLAPR